MAKTTTTSKPSKQSGEKPVVHKETRKEQGKGANQGAGSDPGGRPKK